MAKNKPVDAGSLIAVQDIVGWYEDNPWPGSKAEQSFPLTQTDSTTWKTVSNNGYLKNEAADPISPNSQVPVAGREGYKDVIGEMTSFGKAREMDADEIEKFRDLQIQFQKLQNPSVAQRLVDFYGNDLSFIRNAMYAQMSYMSWAVISDACQFGFLAANSPYMQGLTTMDYGVEAWQKNAVTKSWADSTALILDDIENALDLADTYGKAFLTININKKWFGYVRKNAQVQNYCATLVQSLTSTQAPPTLEAINAMLDDYFGTPVRFNVIDEKVTRASLNDVKTTANPFKDGVAVFSLSTVLGHFEWKPLPIIDSTKETAESFFTVGNKMFIDPSYSKTYAKGRGFPVVDTYADNFYLKIDAVAW